jgi:hypothetical protein
MDMNTDEPLIALDLGSNGGVCRPKTYQEARDWIAREGNFWTWVASTNAGNHRIALDEAINQYSQAIGAIHNALATAPTNEEAARQHLSTAYAFVRAALVDYGLPHSTTPLAARVEQLKATAPSAAIAYLFVFLPRQGGYRFEATDVASWQGFLQGLIEKHQMASPSPEQALAQTATLDSLRQKAEQDLGNRAVAADSLQNRLGRSSDL